VERRGEHQITRDSQTESAAAVRCSALVELSRSAAERELRFDNPVLEVNSRLKQHGTILCFRFQLERRLKLWQRQGGCDKSKRQFFTGGLRGRF
jgi:hypothetical protein